MDQRRHNKWLDLLLPADLHREGLNNDARAGRIHVLLHYKFSQAAEIISHFAPEQPYEAPWPAFRAASFYSNFWLLLDDLWPYLEILWAIAPTLNWEYPSRSFFWLLTFSFLCLYIQWVPIILHICLIGLILRNHFDLHVKLQTTTTTANDTSSMMAAFTPGNLSTFMSNSSTNSMEHHASYDQPTTTTAAAATTRVYNLPQGFHNITDKMTRITTDADTKLTLQNVQNNMSCT